MKLKSESPSEKQEREELVNSVPDLRNPEPGSDLEALRECLLDPKIMPLPAVRDYVAKQKSKASKRAAASSDLVSAIVDQVFSKIENGSAPMALRPNAELDRKMGIYVESEVSTTHRQILSPFAPKK